MRGIPGFLLLYVAGTGSVLRGALWVQIAVVPPGTNNTVRTEVVQPGVVGTIPVAVPGGIPVTPPSASGIGPEAGRPSAVTPGSVPSPATQRAAAPGAVAAGASGAAPMTSRSAALPEGDGCEYRLISAQTEIPAAGGLLEAAIAPPKAGCTPTLAISSTWLQQVGSSAPGRYQFSAAPNVSAARRVTSVVLGTHLLRIEQEGLPTVRAAVSPSRLLFGPDLDGRMKPRRLRLWPEDGDRKLHVSSTAPWVKIGPITTRNSTSVVEISIEQAMLPPGGRHEARLLIATDQPGLAPLEVPVIVERGLVR